MQSKPRLFLATGFVLGALWFAWETGFRNPTSPTVRVGDSSTVVVEPGLGVPNLCEVGMSFSQLKKATGEGSTHGPFDRDGFWSWRRMTRERFALVPSLGVIGVPESSGRFTLLTFHVRPCDSSITCPGLKVSMPFRGRLGERLSFSEGAVTRADVELAFGPIMQTFIGPTFDLNAIDHTRGFSVVGPHGESLYYNHLGLRFELRDGEVVDFSVSRPAK